MKILQVNNFHYLRGGSDRIYLETGAMLERQGHDVMWFSGEHAENPPNAYSEHFPETADLIELKPRDLPRYIYNFDAAHSLERMIAERGVPDVAHLHIYHGGLTTSILRVLRRHNVPVLQTAHEYKLACPISSLERSGSPCHSCLSGSRLNILRHKCKNNSFLHSAAMWAEATVSRQMGDIRLLDGVFCISEFQKDILRRAGVPDHKLWLCNNFVDTTTFAPVHSTEKQDYFLYFGRIEKLKGVETVVKAARATGLPIKFAGSGNWQGELGKAIADLRNAEHLGHVTGEALSRLVAKARAVLVPSEWEEPFGLTVIEAMASGTPVIASRIGAIPELFEDGEHGILFEPGDFHSLALALNGLDRERAIAMGQRAHHYAVERYKPEAYLDRLLSVYQHFKSYSGVNVLH
ncbi:MAG: glycosyltransferase family 4 protein [Pseudomonadota bacterium]